MRILYIVAAIEGFSTLAVEILALRIAAPITGSSSIVTSVFLGIVLLALSAGYWVGGTIASGRTVKQIRALLVRYLIGAGLWYALISFGLEGILLQTLLDWSSSYLLTLFVTAVVLFFLPVFVASQIIPLLTELLDDASKGKAAGKMLFASTIGSFLGSVGTSLILFPVLGVRLTGIIVACLLIASSALLLWKHHRTQAIMVIIGSVLLAVVLFLVRSGLANNVLYSFDSAYQHIQIEEIATVSGDARIFLTDNAYASALFVESMTSPFAYIQEAFARTKDLSPQDVLVIGTAGFTYPYELAIRIESIEHIDAVDVDPRVEYIAETYFLQTDLPDEIVFHADSARYFVQQTKDVGGEYDLIFLDAFHGKTVPGELTTREFFTDVDTLLGTDGVLLINFILDRDLSSDLAQSLAATLTSVFGEVWIKQVTSNDEERIENFIVSTKRFSDDYMLREGNNAIYTDDMRTTELDTMQMYW